MCSSNVTVLLSNLSLSRPVRGQENDPKINSKSHVKAHICLSTTDCCTTNLTADETCGLEDLFFSLLLTSQVSKRVNDDTKDEIQHNDDHQEEEQKIIHDTCSEQMLLEAHTQVSIEVVIRKNELSL